MQNTVEPGSSKLYNKEDFMQEYIFIIRAYIFIIRACVKFNFPLS
jgi:hypothetical protein